MQISCFSLVIRSKTSQFLTKSPESIVYTIGIGNQNSTVFAVFAFWNIWIFFFFRKKNCLNKLHAIKITELAENLNKQ